MNELNYPPGEGMAEALNTVRDEVLDAMNDPFPLSKTILVEVRQGERVTNLMITDGVQGQIEMAQKRIEGSAAELDGYAYAYPVTLTPKDGKGAERPAIMVEFQARSLALACSGVWLVKQDLKSRRFGLEAPMEVMDLFPGRLR